MSTHSSFPAAAPMSAHREDEGDVRHHSRLGVTFSQSAASLVTSTSSSQLAAGMPALRSDGDLAPLPPADGPTGLEAFFAGLSAGDEMTGLIQTLRRTVLSHFFTRGDSSVVSASLSSSSSLASSAMPLRRATKAAMLFSTEHPDAADEATFLYYSPSTHDSLRQECQRNGSGQAKSAIVHGTRHAFPLRGGRVRALLSDRAAATLARRYLREKNDVRAALKVMAEVDPTPAVHALLIECHNKSGDCAQALASLQAIPSCLWTEVDVSLVIRTLYHAALSAEREALPPKLLEEPLRILQGAIASGVMWSSPAAVNDALGLLSLDSSRWPDAVALLDLMLLPPARGKSEGVASTAEPNASSLSSDRHSLMMTTAPAYGSEMLTFYPSSNGRPNAMLDELDRHSTGVAEREVATESKRNLAEFGSRSAMATRFLRPNAITVYQACCALRARPDLAFFYANTLTKTYDIAVTADFKATEAFLRACVRQGHWEAALELLHRSATPHKDDTSPLRVGRESELMEEEAPGRVFSADLLVSLLSLLGEHNASQHYQDVLSRVCAVASSRANGERSRCGEAAHRVSGLELSRHYSTDTLSRAYNTMIQHATTVTDAESFYEELQSLMSSRHTAHGEPGDLKGSSRDANKANSARLASAAAAGDTCEGAFLENESYEKLTFLYAEAGDWERALGCLNTLLHHPKRRFLYVPTTAIHDAVQYALEQSSSPTAFPATIAGATGDSVHSAAAGGGGGAPWQVSVALFREMCDRGVGTSTIAFQSVVKTCFSQGASEEAQKLFQLILRRGIRR